MRHKWLLDFLFFFLEYEIPLAFSEMCLLRYNDFRFHLFHYGNGFGQADDIVQKEKKNRNQVNNNKKKQVRNVVFSAEIRVLDRSLSKQISFSRRHEIRDFKLCPKEGSRED